MLTVKYNNNGVQLWSLEYDGSAPGSFDHAFNIALDRSDNVYVAGVSGDDICTIKYSNDGSQVWAKTYHGPGAGSSGYISVMTLDKEDNVYVTCANDNSGTLSDIVLIKYDSSGATKWVTRYNGAMNLSDVSRDIAADNKGFVYVTGVINDDANLAASITIKYNATTGDTIWTRKYDNPGYDNMTEIGVDNDGNVYTAGQAGITSGAAMILKYNSSGVLQWTKSFKIGTYDCSFFTSSGYSINDMIVDEDGNIYLGGTIGSIYAYATAKYNNAGTQVWGKMIENLYVDIIFGITIDDCKNTYITGRTNSSTTGPSDDMGTAKYGPDGDALWVYYNLEGNRNNWGQAIAADSKGCAYVTGFMRTDTTPNNSVQYMKTVKYCTPSPLTPAFSIAQENCSGNVEFTDSSYGASISRWEWDFGDHVSVQNYASSENPSHSYNEPNTYTVTLSIAGINCSGGGSISKIVTIDQFTSSIKEIPNVFTPNGDGKNEEFTINTTSDYDLKIYDRWGKEMYSGNQSTPWNGKVKENNLPEGTYFYVISSGGCSEETSKQSGTVMVLK